MKFDRIAILDWSAAKGPKRGKDSIWLAEASATTCSVQNIATRPEAEAALARMIDTALAQGHRLLLGADFAFGAPQGFVAHLTGQASALSWWGWLAARITDSPGNVSNYRQIAAEMNGLFPGGGPFWGNNERAETPGLPRTKPPLPPGLVPYRQTDLAARGPGALPKPVWQLAGAGAVGAQVLTGLPMLHRLRQRYAGQVSVWPFQPPTTQIVLAEVYPSLLAEQVRAEVIATHAVPDAVQVRLLATALVRLSPTDMAQVLQAPPCPEDEGWILGAGKTALLQAALG